MAIMLPLIVQMGTRYDRDIGVYLIKVDLEISHNVVFGRHELGGNSNRHARSGSERWELLFNVVLDRGVGFNSIGALPSNVWSYGRGGVLAISRGKIRRQAMCHTNPALINLQLPKYIAEIFCC